MAVTIASTLSIVNVVGFMAFVPGASVLAATYQNSQSLIQEQAESTTLQSTKTYIHLKPDFLSSNNSNTCNPAEDPNCTTQGN